MVLHLAIEAQDYYVGEASIGGVPVESGRPQLFVTLWGKEAAGCERIYDVLDWAATQDAQDG